MKYIHIYICTHIRLYKSMKPPLMTNTDYFKLFFFLVSFFFVVVVMVLVGGCVGSSV